MLYRKDCALCSSKTTLCNGLTSFWVAAMILLPLFRTCLVQLALLTNFLHHKQFSNSRKLASLRFKLAHSQEQKERAHCVWWCEKRKWQKLIVDAWRQVCNTTAKKLLLGSPTWQRHVCRYHLWNHVDDLALWSLRARTRLNYSRYFNVGKLAEEEVNGFDIWLSISVVQKVISRI